MPFPGAETVLLIYTLPLFTFDIIPSCGKCSPSRAGLWPQG
ncbi:hypothetical protein HMPREF0742_02437 [Rothia aeria F0184]|uniref:Uncharacterized protein n=1 Tax=Rothia aeria F0184 TaxID=888019 RepID=U7UX90_9MICC|nr:hypothetical protein HMPREF0742_02437 [Rothia aeria F0184]